MFCWKNNDSVLLRRNRQCPVRKKWCSGRKKLCSVWKKKMVFSHEEKVWLVLVLVMFPASLYTLKKAMTAGPDADGRSKQVHSHPDEVAYIYILHGF